MRAAVFQGPGLPLAIETVADPAPGPNDVVLKVAYSGVCGTDLHVTQPGIAFVQPGQILGHEFSGEVVAVGANVRDQWQLGDRATSVPFRPCPTCGTQCRRGLDVLCPDVALMGIVAMGGNAEYVACGAGQLVAIAEGVDMRIGALTEPLAVGYHAVRKAGPLFGHDVLVIGAGPVGLAVASFARLAGAREVVVSEYAEQRRGLALTMGATATIDPGREDVGAAFAKIAGHPPQVVFECVGVPGMIQLAVQLVDFLGRVIVVGACMERDHLMPMAALAKEVVMHFVLGNTRDDFRFVGTMLAQGRIAAAPMITGEVDFAAFPAAFEALRQPNSQCKLLLRPN